MCVEVTTKVPLQRSVVIVCIAVCIAGSMVWLLHPAESTETPRRPGAPSPPASVPATSVPSPPPTPRAVSPHPGSSDPYRLLPNSAQQFRDAIDTVQRFASAYGTYRWNEDPRDHVARLRQWASPELLRDLSGLLTAPGLIDGRRRARRDAVADASATSIRALTPSSIVFVVTVRQRTTMQRARAATDTQFLAVEVQKASDRWQVHSVEPATLTDGDFQ